MYIRMFFDLLLYQHSTNVKLNHPQRQELLCQLHSIFKREAASRIFLEIVARKAATARMLIRDLEIPEQTFYSSIRWLLQNELIVKAAPLSRSKGKKAAIYAVPEYTPNDVAMATREDRFMGSPGFIEVKRISDLVMGKYLTCVRSPDDDKTLLREKLYDVMKLECHGFRWFDFKRDVERMVTQQGFKVV